LLQAVTRRYRTDRFDAALRRVFRHPRSHAAPQHSRLRRRVEHNQSACNEDEQSEALGYNSNAYNHASSLRSACASWLQQLRVASLLGCNRFRLDVLL